MSDPFRRARDDDRDAAVDQVEAAFADGQITQPDRDLRVDRVRRAETLGEVQMLVQDLRPGAEPGVSRLAPLAPRPPASVVRRPPRLPGRGIALAVAAVVVGVGAVVPLAVFSGGDRDGAAVETFEVTQMRDLTTARGWDLFLDALQDKTGSREVFTATVYDGYAVVEVPVGDQGQRSFGYYFDGDWQDWTGRGTAEEERFDLARIDGSVVQRLVKKVRSRIEDPTAAYVLVNSPGREEGVCLSAYATNDVSATAYLDARCDGKVVFSYASE